MNKVLSLQSLKAEKETELRAARWSSISLFICK